MSRGAAWPPPEPADFDLRVDAVEVTQATQTAANSIPLVARKSTAVRATIGLYRSGFGTFPPSPRVFVTGRLHVFVNGVEVTPTTGIPPINAPFEVPKYPKRGNEDDTLNFELYAPTPIPASADVDFRVDVLPPLLEADPANNSGFANNLTAVERCTPWFYFTRVNYTPSGLGFPPFDDVKPGRGDAFLRGVLPVDDSSLLYQETTPVTYSFDPNGNGILDSGTEHILFADFLEFHQQLIVRNYVGANDRVLLYGWLAGNPIDGNGSLGDRVAFGNTQSSRYQRTFVHEYIHELGLSHNPSTREGLDEVGWDVGARLVQNPAGNGETNRVKRVTNPATGPDFDVMTPNKLTNEAWINTTNYRYLLNHPRLIANCSPAYLRPRAVVVTGLVRVDGAMEIQRVFRFPWKSEPTELGEGRLLVEVTDTNGVTTTRRFDPRPAVHSTDESDATFSVVLPVDPNAEIASLRLIDADRMEQLAERDRSEPPSVTIVSPKRGDALGDQTDVQWAVEDPDTPDSGLLFQAAYSQDNGRSGNPIGVDIAGMERGFTFDASEIPESAGEGIIRVFVSDGLNTAFDDVTELTLR